MDLLALKEVIHLAAEAAAEEMQQMLEQVQDAAVLA
jgi:hypothetical protein